MGAPRYCWPGAHVLSSLCVSPLIRGRDTLDKAKALTSQIALQGTSKVSRQLQLQEEDITLMQENRSPLSSPLVMKNV